MASRPTIQIRDVLLLGSMPVWGLLSWSLPERQWAGFARRLARLQRLVRRKLNHRVSHIATVAGRRPLAYPPDDTLTAYSANLYLDRLRLLKNYCPGAWQAEGRLEGREHIDAALEAGKGAILWIVPLIFAAQVGKLALHRAGYDLVHLSAVTHGFSQTLVGQRLINPICTRIEDRYLAERLMIGDDDTKSVLVLLSRRLRDNRLISIRAGHSNARRLHEVPFMDGIMRFAAGPIILALTTRAPLLPVFTVREPDGSFATTIEAPVVIPAGKDAETICDDVLRTFAARLEDYVTRYPDQFSWQDVQAPNVR